MGAKDLLAELEQIGVIGDAPAPQSQPQLIPEDRSELRQLLADTIDKFVRLEGQVQEHLRELREAFDSFGSAEEAEEAKDEPEIEVVEGEVETEEETDKEEEEESTDEIDSETPEG